MSTDELMLTELRDQIDAIDEEIHDLIMRRATLVEDLRKTKQGARGSYYRPAREAEVLRRLVARHRGRFPVQALVRMWRELMSATVRLQGPFTLAVYAPDGNQDLMELAREHFGLSAALTPHHSGFSVVRAVRDGTATVGILPVPDQSQDERWWPGIAEAPPDMRPLITARIPFAASVNETAALVIGNIVHEPTGADHSYLLVRATEPVSRGRLSQLLVGVDLEPMFLDSQVDEKEHASSLFLVEVGDFVSPDDDRVMELMESESTPVDEVVVLGGYALPLTTVDSRATA